ncbi:MAG TPA: endonuclease/exonuclease/phosphatase family protein [Candidatus Dormibacteraeota bacterium]|nr:endonuclease/exonuclease/phosphatase family protein [Candidatus Dormibacteraeota bacterium]
MDVRIGTRNLENLFRPGVDFGPRDDAVYRQKLDGLAATIDQMAPDLLGVEEVGSADALNDLVALLSGEWHVELSQHFDAHHPIRVGFLSRKPLTVLEDLSTFPNQLIQIQSDDRAADGTSATVSQMGRGALAVQIEPVAGKRLTVVCCHLKSKLLSFPGRGGRIRFTPHDEGERARFAGYALYRRTAEAVSVRGLADQLPGAGGMDGRQNAVVVLGDLNDEPDAATTQILYGPLGSQFDTGAFDVADTGDAMRLWNLAWRLPEGERSTRRFRGRNEIIDHILISQVLLHATREVRVVLQAGLAQPPSITEDPSARRNVPASDHGAVLARFDL